MELARSFEFENFKTKYWRFNNKKRRSHLSPSPFPLKIELLVYNAIQLNYENVFENKLKCYAGYIEYINWRHSHQIKISFYRFQFIWRSSVLMYSFFFNFQVKCQFICYVSLLIETLFNIDLLFVQLAISIDHYIDLLYRCGLRMRVYVYSSVCECINMPKSLSRIKLLYTYICCISVPLVNRSFALHFYWLGLRRSSSMTTHRHKHKHTHAITR